MAAVLTSRGWGNDVCATPNQWLYHDGGGNWACLRFQDKGRAVLLGHDHEYSDTYFGEAAEYFDKEETDLLTNAPDWWSLDLELPPFGAWIGFIYGWDGNQWQRAAYDPHDGFEQVNLLEACSISSTQVLSQFAMDAPGLKGKPPNPEALSTLVAADADVTDVILEAVVPGWDIAAGVAAARKFLDAGVA
ncbi:hypothetical protein PN498_03895 [Oscillatoria sp. CS-180]|uniref:hypothetical protein n=1 Tax=Oscillatoria sp. CS-180 TaxID=3021720 RepID=UPI002330C4A8|nr:hypothetical protein [Oscillatoria sp. CS-180]MDB9525118.1 hypothetical protein [Oscillatoria sp. CS-180]